MMINGETKICAVIGNPIAHTLSPLIHNTAFRREDLITSMLHSRLKT